MLLTRPRLLTSYAGMSATWRHSSIICASTFRACSLWGRGVVREVCPPVDRAEEVMRADVVAVVIAWRLVRRSKLGADEIRIEELAHLLRVLGPPNRVIHPHNLHRPSSVPVRVVDSECGDSVCRYDSSATVCMFVKNGGGFGGGHVFSGIGCALPGFQHGRRVSNEIRVQRLIRPGAGCVWSLVPWLCKQVLCLLLLGCRQVPRSLLKVGLLQFRAHELAAHFHCHETFGTDAGEW